MAAMLKLSEIHMLYSPSLLANDHPPHNPTNDLSPININDIGFGEGSALDGSSLTVAGEMVFPAEATDESVGNSPASSVMMCGSDTKRMKVNPGCRIGFRTKSEVEVLDDGYKWRKYGKKSVKNSPNPRNYYRCSSEGCRVKKRVERDGQDSSYVITTYDGIHNHTSPGGVAVAARNIPQVHPSTWPSCFPSPFLPVDEWSMHASHSSF